MRKPKLRKAKKISQGWEIKDSLGDWVQVIRVSYSKSLYNRISHICFRDEYDRPFRFRPKDKVMSRKMN